jgi:hypothetical protein
MFRSQQLVVHRQITSNLVPALNDVELGHVSLFARPGSEDQIDANVYALSPRTIAPDAGPETVRAPIPCVRHATRLAHRTTLNSLT